MRIITALLMVISLGIFYSCGQRPNQEEDRIVLVREVKNRLGDQLIDSLIESEAAFFYGVHPQFPSGYTLQEAGVVLENDDLLLLREIFLSDSSYVFGMSKRALFIPEVGLEFRGAQHVMILFSPSSQQIEFIQGEKTLKVDIDPSFSKIKNIIYKYTIEG